MIGAGQYWQDGRKRIFEVLDVAENPYEHEQQVVFSIVGEGKHLIMSADLFMSKFHQIMLLTPDMATQLVIFNRLFNTRHDVYAVRWFNKNEGKWQYSPSRDFNTRNLLPLTDQVITQHLLGKKFIGLYPMTPDNRTSFLVLDVDKRNWREIVPAIRAVMAELQLKTYVEVSQSGNGAHFWIFFVAPVYAVYARQFGQLIINRAMQLNPRIDFDAFDRMLPHQDRLPAKGFGNLIAAPLQGERTQFGRSVFIDGNFVPYQNQWAILATAQQLSEAQLRDLIDTLRQKIDEVVLTTPIESAVLDVAIGNSLSVNLESLSDVVVQQLRNMATLSNPEYFKLLKARRSVYKTPRYLSFATFTGDALHLPRGLFRKLVSNFQVQKIIDQRVSGKMITATFNGTLYPEQQQALEGAKEVQEGILVARTGFGKTVVAAALIAARQVSTLVVVPKADLGRQWRQELERFLTIANEPEKSYTASGRERKQDSKIGQWFAQKKQLTGLVDIITIQALAQMKDLTDFYSRYGMVIFDEVHHNAALTYDSAVSKVNSKYLYGLTATFSRSDDLTALLNLRFGEVVFESAKVETTTLITVKRTAIIKHTEFGENHPEMAEAGFVQLNQELVYDDARIQQIVTEIKKRSTENQLVLVNRVDHANVVFDLLSNSSLDVYVLTGRVPGKQREETFAKLKHAEQPFILIATGSIAGEGLDLTDLTVLHLTSPRSFAGTIAQYLGRLERGLDQKDRLTVIDYADVHVPMLSRMYLKRLRTYRSLFYDVIDEE